MQAVVFALHGCPAGWLGGYGNEWVVTTALDRLAAEGVVFDNHYADNPDPAAARRAWLTARDQHTDLPPGGSGLLQILGARSVRAVLVRANRPAHDAPPWYYAGWAEVFDARPDPADDSPADALVRALPAVLDSLAGHGDWLVWVELDQLLPPWEVPAAVFEAYAEDLTEDAEPDSEPLTPWDDPPLGPFDATDDAAWELLHRSFAAAVTTFDAELGRVFDVLRGRGLDRTAAWVVTSDFGFPLGEHGYVGPGRPTPHEEAVHLPLILRLPGGAEAGTRVAALTQPADLPATLLALCGGVPAGADGHDLRPLWEGRAEAVRDAAVTGWRVGDATGWAVRTADWALIDGGDGPRLYERPADRGELNDVASAHPGVVEELATREPKV